MKKLVTVALLLTLAFTLAACGGTSTPASSAPAQPDTSSTASSESTPPVSSTPDSSTDDISPSIDIPDNGTPPDAPAPFEAHAGDKGYFFVSSDDYVIAMIDISNIVPGYDVAKYGEGFYYLVGTIYDFEGTDHYGNEYMKWVFADNASAQSYLDDNFSDFGESSVVIENVIYSTNPAQPSLITKEDRIQQLQDKGYDVYVSKP